MLGSRRHRLGNRRRLLRGEGPGLGDAGDEALGQLGGTLQGAAGVGADVLEGGEGNHEGEDCGPHAFPTRVATMKHTTEQNAEKHQGHGAKPWSHITNKLTAVVAALMALASVTAASAEEKKVTIPAGTALLVKLDKAVSSSDKPGTKFGGVLQGDLTGDGVAAVKAGSAVFGEVKEAKKAKRVRGKAEVTFALSQVRIDGQLVPMVTQPIEDIAASSTKKTAKGAAAGAAIGAIADGGDGAAKGAAIGAGASAVKKGESAGSKAGALVEFKLAAPLTVTVKQ